MLGEILAEPWACMAAASHIESMIALGYSGFSPCNQSWSISRPAVPGALEGQVACTLGLCIPVRISGHTQDSRDREKKGKKKAENLETNRLPFSFFSSFFFWCCVDALLIKYQSSNICQSANPLTKQKRLVLFPRISNINHCFFPHSRHIQV